MNGYCLDTSAWLEYFNAGSHGPQVRSILERSPEVYTPAIVATEIIEAARLRKNNTRLFLDFIQAKTRFADVTAPIARLAGRINADLGHRDGAWGLMESLILATARHHKVRLLTRDPIYTDLDDVEMLRPTIVGEPRGTG